MSKGIQRVIETQRKKKALAELLLSPDRHSESEKSLDKLRVSLNKLGLVETSLMNA